MGAVNHGGAMLAVALAATVAGTGPATAAPQILGGDAPACASGEGPAVLADVQGLRDRRGFVMLELYPDNDQDFLKDDRDLLAQGKLFRRVKVSAPATGPVVMCLRVPRPGRYAILFTHDRDGKNKFNFWSDGAGFASMSRIGRARPRLKQAEVDVGQRVTPITIHVQYLHGLGGFSPST